jgi:transcription-repair coupling factor (superfamily II helicase)
MNTLHINSLPDLNGAGDKQRWDGVAGAGSSLLLANYAEKAQGLTVIVTENTQQAERLLQEAAFFSAQGIPLLEFPDWEILPYDNFSPHQDIISARLTTLSSLPLTQKGLLILPVSTLLHHLVPQSYIKGMSLKLTTGQELNRDILRKELEAAGYLRVESVYEHGEFTVRGSIMDIFPMGGSNPVRIELFDDEIESLRYFDADTQLSRDKIDSVNLLPGKEFPLTDKGIATFRQNFREAFDIDVRKCPLYEDISRGVAVAGIEYYLPLFFSQISTLFDYLPENTCFFTLGEVGEAAELFWHDVRLRYEDRRVDPERPLLPPGELFMAADQLFAEINHYPHVSLKAIKDNSGHASLPVRAIPDLDVEHKTDKPLQKLQTFLTSVSEYPVLFCTDSPGRREALIELLGSAGIHPESIEDWQDFVARKPSLGITVAPLENGLWLEDPAMILLTENQLFTDHVSQPRRRGKYTDNTDFIIKSLTELNINSPVVHIDHGVGRYKGLETFEVESHLTEFLVLEYADEARLYVPVSSLHLINRYSGSDAEHAPLNKLGSDQWEKAKRKAAEKVVDVAAELLDVYARREAQKGVSFELHENEYRAFTNSFPFEETEDQQDTIDAVAQDLQKAKPMDRLVCGDVGFGKTEVALRAAFIAVTNNTQVAILVPTTLLAQQHYENFKDRFADWPVNIALMSRFVTGQKHTENMANVAAGKVDIVIGTHKLLQGDVKYKNLGLLIIDEEHRFGVRQKETLKALRANVDILTLTATPIPRTLNMAMSGIRDLSIIATPPARRLSVKTFVRQSSSALIKEAVQRELLRGGQVFYLHNEVKTIENAAEEIRKLIPEAKVCVGHGQLRESLLEKVMSDFYHRRFNVLVCSTIIESGIDVPTANTIIVERADKFGLAQLHQLRGRVGRSHHQAYAYLLTPEPKAMSADALKRIDAIGSADTLGAGFVLASHDLEIRGAGELLGDEQSGHIQTIGFSLYSEMLEHTVNLMKQGKHPDLNKPIHTGTEINLHIPALITEDYLPDVHTRLMMYKRIANASNKQELDGLKIEMIDRFGLLPEATKLLFEVTLLKLQAEAMGICKVEANARFGKVLFDAETTVEPFTIVKLVQDLPQVYAMGGASELKFKHELSSAQERIAFTKSMLEALSPEALQVA